MKTDYDATLRHNLQNHPLFGHHCFRDPWLRVVHWKNKISTLSLSRKKIKSLLKFELNWI